MLENIQDFVVKKDKKFVDGFSEEIISSVGYGTKTAIDKETNENGLVPMPIEIKSGSRMISNPDCYAKAIHFKGNDTPSCFIKIDANGNIVDPWGIHKNSKEEKFKKIDDNLFLRYLDYLTSKNKAKYRLCEREYKDK